MRVGTNSLSLGDYIWNRTAPGVAESRLRLGACRHCVGRWPGAQGGRKLMAAQDDVDRAMSPLRVFGAELRYYRTRAGMSQDQLGARVYCSGDLVGKIENG